MGGRNRIRTCIKVTTHKSSAFTIRVVDGFLCGQNFIKGRKAMNRIWTIVFFVVLFLLIIALYVYVYHFKKHKVLAITLAAILGVSTALSIVFVLPFPHRSTIIEAETTPMEIQKIGQKYYAVCTDGTQYPMRAMNTEITAGYFSYQNDNKYANEKVELVRRYDYKIWWLIPAYSLEEETQIYFNNEVFNDIYGCNLDINETHR